MLVGVVSDTHAPRFWKGMPATVATLLDGVDLILHAGDLCTTQVLDDLAAIAPVVAVLGNNDGPDVAGRGVPEIQRLEIEGVKVGMIHDSGPSKGRPARLRRLFPDEDLVVFGHSHIPWDHEENGQHSFNPGSPTERRRQPTGTMGLLELVAGEIRQAMIVAV